MIENEMKILKVLRSIADIVYKTIASCIIMIGTTLIIMFCVGVRPYAVQTGSMEPEIMTGSLCFVNHKAAYESITIGDIIAFKLESGMMVTHRVVEISEEGLITKGDANNAVDANVITDVEYVGKTFYWIPNIGYLMMFIRTRRGIIISVSVFLIFFLIGFLFQDDDKNDDKNTEKKAEESENENITEEGK